MLPFPYMVCPWVKGLDPLWMVCSTIHMEQNLVPRGGGETEAQVVLGAEPWLVYIVGA